MKKYIYCFCVIFLLFSCSKKVPGTYANKELGISVVFPTSWKINERAKGAVVIASDLSVRKDSYIKENINIVTEKHYGDLNLDEYVAKAMENIKKVLPGLTEIERKSISIKNVTAIRSQYIYSHGSLKVQAVAYTIMRKTDIFVITGIADSNRFPVMLPVYDKIASSFTISKR